MSQGAIPPRDTLPYEEKVEIVISAANEKLAEYCVDIPNDSDSISLVINNKKEPSTKETATASKTVPTSSNDIIKAEDKETRTRLIKLYQAAMKGDSSYKVLPRDRTAKISTRGDTALHIATTSKTSDFAIKLVREMSKEELETENEVGNTAFCLAAASGKLELAKAMMKRHNGLAKKPGRQGTLPIYMAALFGHEDMVNYLYDENEKLPIDAVEKVPIDLRSDGTISLLRTMITSGLYAVPLDLIKRLKDKPLDTARHENLEMVLLQALAQMPSAIHSPQQGVWKRCFNLFSGSNKKQARQLVEELWKQAILSETCEFHRIIENAKILIFAAAKQGNTEFLSVLIGEYPDLILEKENDKNNYTIFHFAVKNRHNDIFKFIYKIGSFKDLIVPYEDEEKNNILHLAAKLAPLDRLNIVSGAALQMQRELLWFEAVRKTMNILDTEAENKDNKTPRALFTEEHSKLKKNGEEWMKDTANSCMIVATLIATVVFAAAFTVPGGTREESGSPNFLREASFTIFAISDAVSLISSSCSILTFLSILTSRYAEDDFIWRLPTKLLVGVTTLFVSIIAMMVVFSTTFFIIFNDGLLGRAVLISSIASIPVFLFIFLQSHLFVDIVRSTYFSSSLFQPSKCTLSFKKWKTSEAKKVK